MLETLAEQKVVTACDMRRVSFPYGFDPAFDLGRLSLVGETNCGQFVASAFSLFCV